MTAPRLLAIIITVFLLGIFIVSPVRANPEPGSVTTHTAHAEDDFTFSPEQSKSRFLGDFIRWTFEDAGNLPRTEATLAVGSSSMRMWKTINQDLAPLEILQRGFGGSRMANVLEMIDFFKRYQANTILVYQGDNDLASPQSSVDRYVSECKEFIAAMKSVAPEANIYFISTKPSPSRKQAMDRFSEANKQILALCAEDPNLHFIDVYSKMLNENGEPIPEIFKKDRLHMNEAGYKIWRKEVRKAMNLPE